MNQSFDSTGAQFAWDSTSLKIAEECPYKYKLRMLEGWTPHRRSVHLDFGGWYASALESFHTYRAAGQSHDDALAEVVHEALEESWEYDLDEAGEPIPGTGAAWSSDHNAKTRENLIRTIVWYCEQFADDPCETVILSSGKPAVEHSFRLEVDDGIVLCGHLDRLVNYGDKTYVQDQKTTGTTITPRYFEQWNLDTQMSLYTFAGRAIFNLPIKGVIIDAAQIAVGFSRFERGFTFRDEAQLEEWYDHTMQHIASIRKMTAERRFPMNTTSCDKYGGCMYKNVCAKSPSVRQNFMDADFKRSEPWDPIKPR